MLINNDRSKAMNLFLTQYFQGRILDVGCRDARMLNRNLDITYLDIEDRQLPNFVKHDLNKLPLPFEDDSFDTVFAAGIIEHVESPYLLIKEFKRILSLGGNLIVNLPNIHFIGKYLACSVIHMPTHINLLCSDTMENIFKKQGWCIVDKKYGWLLTGSSLIGKAWQFLPNFLQNEYWLVANNNEGYRADER